MADALGSNAYLGVAEGDHIGIHKDSNKFFDVTEISLKQDIEVIDVPILRPGVYKKAEQRLLGGRSFGEGFKSLLAPEDGVFLLRHLLGSVSSVQQGMTLAYKHTFLGANSVPANGLSFTKYMETMAVHFFGGYVTSATFEFELNQPVYVSWTIIGKDIVDDVHANAGLGSAGTSRGQNAITFPVTLVASTSDQISLNVNGAGAVVVTIAAGTYNTGVALVNAINTAIAANTSLLTLQRNPIAGCYVDSSNKLNFYSYSKGTSSTIAWTAGTNDAGTLLGRGTPVEAAGTSTVPTPVYSTLAPFIYCQGILKIDGVEAQVDKFSLTIDNQLQKKDVLGRCSMVGVNTVERVVSGTFTKWLTGDEVFEKFRGNADASLEINLRSNVVADTGYNYDQDIFLKKIRYNNPEPGVSAPDPIREEVPFVSYYYDATYGDVRIDVTNLTQAYV